MKGVARTEPEMIGSISDGVYSLIISNLSGVNIFLDTEKKNPPDNTDSGIPIKNGDTLVITKWKGELWISAEADKSEFRYIRSSKRTF